MSYRDNAVYAELEHMAGEAGFKVVYTEVQPDIYAHARDNVIEMPEEDVFDCGEQAALILGHEMGHLLTGFGSGEILYEHQVRNEAFCDLAGVLLYQLAEATAGHKAELALMEAFGDSEVTR